MFDKNKVKDVAKLAMIEIDEKDLEFFSQEIVDFLKLVEQTESLDLYEIDLCTMRQKIHSMQERILLMKIQKMMV